MARHLVLFAILLATADAESISPLKHVTVREGGTVTIPCLYDSRYKLQPKYWCRGATWVLCSINAHTNRTGKWLITDDPSQNIFTVELQNLTTSDSGTYWCAVEMSKKLDPREHVYLTVKAVPDVSVVSSSVSGREGGNVRVQCLYSSTFKNNHKQWCRIIDKRCYPVGKSGTSQYSVQITDNEREYFTVVMSGLMLRDSGWYYCSVGDLQAPVQLFVQWTNTSKNSKDLSLDNATSPLNGIVVLLWITGPLLLLLLLMAFFTWRIKQRYIPTCVISQDSLQYCYTLNRSTLFFLHQDDILFTPGPDHNSTADDSMSLRYCTVAFEKAKDDKEDDHISIRCSPDRDDDVVYSTVKHLR